MSPGTLWRGSRRLKASQRSLRGQPEMLIGMDNQGCMPVPVESSQLASDNLRLMQSVVSPRCILMGSVRMPEQGRGTQGSDLGTPAAVKRQAGGDQEFSREAACEP
jgi:hypothetical protein